MSTNLNQEYVTHDHIRRRMRWLLMLIVVFGASLFFAYAVKDETTLKEFMLTPFNNPAMPMEGLPTSNSAAEKRSDIEQQVRTAITLWDERQPKGSEAGHLQKTSNKVVHDNCATCSPASIQAPLPDPSLVEGTTNHGA